eukprot:TRINITY_DN1157_c2_g1_i1.p1 TRINITY_DN1157_c2_g1~~TRINITY_DN1157_c2_g1_i1.p1  ORF type:complete len:232 (+),score=13.99 TRINITY_DN1157_c2_g1_i1:117-812(+)
MTGPAATRQSTRMYSSLFRELAKRHNNEASQSTRPCKETQKKKRVRKGSSSSPHNQAWFFCSYGGQIMRMSHNLLAYAGGVTKVIEFRYDSTFSDLQKVISEHFGDDLVFHYEHYPVDIKRLVPVRDDESLRNMIDDIKSRQYKMPTMQAILFPSHYTSLDAHIVGSIDDDPDLLNQRYLDALKESRLRKPSGPTRLIVAGNTRCQDVVCKNEIRPSPEDNASGCKCNMEL